MPETAGEGGRLALSATALTHVGAVRTRNEDTVAVDDWIVSASMHEPLTLRRIVDRPLVCLVADGLGGHAGGDVASHLVAEHLTQYAAEATDPDRLADLLRVVDQALLTAMRERPALDGMGSTVAGLHVAPSGVMVFNVGDSRVYGIEPTGLVQLSTDDTPGPKLADGRTAAYSTALITQSLGGWQEPGGLTPHVTGAPAAGRYLLCSDGLTDRLDPGAIAAHIGDDDAASVTALFEAAMAAGGDDNISIVLVGLRPA